MATAAKKPVQSGSILNRSKGISKLQIAILILLFVVAGVVYKVYSHASGSGNPYLSSCPTPHATIKAGTSNAGCTKYLQYALNQPAGGSHGLVVDGKFGGGTTSAAKSFQSSKGLTADGIVGANTWSAIDKTVSSATKSVSSYHYGTLAFNDLEGKIYVCKTASKVYFKITTKNLNQGQYWWEFETGNWYSASADSNKTIYDAATITGNDFSAEITGARQLTGASKHIAVKNIVACY